MDILCTVFLIVSAICSGGVFGANVTARSNIGIPDKQPLELNCSFANFDKEKYAYLTDFIWSKEENGNQKQIFHLYENSTYRFMNEWKDKGVAVSYPVGITFLGDVNILLPARYVTADMAGTYNCFVLAEEGSLSSNVTVDIYYGPRNTVRINDNNFTINTFEGDNVTLTCRADCMPACNYSWYFRSKLLLSSDDGVLYVYVIDRKETGNYTCVARNVVDNSSKEINLVIFHGPGHQIWFEPPESSVTILEGATFVVGCHSVCNPLCRSYWYKGSRHVQTEGDILRLTRVARADNGTYTCIANNSVSHKKKKLELAVNYGPGVSVTFKPGGNKHTFLEGRSLSVTCSATCNPNCTYSWFKPSGVFVTNKVLSLDHTVRDDAGNYTCGASNVVSSSNSSFNLNIIFPPTIVDLNTSKGHNVVNENNTVVFSCSVTANPAANITWTNLRTGATLRQQTSVLTSTYKIDKAGYIDAVNYSCSARNGIGNEAEQSVELFVNCAPRKDSRVTTKDIVHIRLNSQLSYVINVIAYPPPQFTWYHVVNRDLILINPPHYRHLDTKVSSTLKIASVQLKDFGQYFVNVSNNQGNCAIGFQLLRADSPAVPTDFVCTGHTKSSIRLQWVSQDNHGAKQKFHIKYKDHKNKEWFNCTEEFDDPGLRKRQEAKITELSPNVLYRFRLYGRNKWGYSDFRETSCFTAGPSEQDLTFGQGIGVGIATSLATCLCIIAVVHVYRWKYRRYQGFMDSGFLLDNAHT